ncbi:MAG TPA: tRNA (N6-threonylcarbamoyladenosine(37)-N6)-methyltransferase TrmO [Desulfobacter sp.]|uniref:tRNA (N6-threonylcarbamoyladenosine(37)-N6)-methyltransferase TrmO n=1 Tax=Desulfobacter sp. UBA2225 TaxID=1961413 RepID=UPI000E92F33F|nr:tRNA (N6-threonylcarbamoyladenosine(37)-N6)-methyltransferase TrmO [Desulfobacter sp. UBA2225]HAR32711.1 tRNA (N6-threonylcarbamoyladenosine(37)-N6)-methyltransferase TrmO [Desulfobacter sp.]
MTNDTPIPFKPIGFVRTNATKLPRHWSVSQEKGVLEIHPEFAPALRDIETGQKIVVLFHFHKSPAFNSGYLFQTPPHRSSSRGVFSICSPIRPNAIGMSIIEVTNKNQGHIGVKHIDMIDGTPILDIKPLITGEEDCPSAE